MSNQDQQQPQIVYVQAEPKKKNGWFWWRVRNLVISIIVMILLAGGLGSFLGSDDSETTPRVTPTPVVYVYENGDQS